MAREFLVLLGGSNTNLCSNARLPTNNEPLQLLTTVDLNPVPGTNDSQSDIVNDDSQIKITEIYATLWNERRKNQWYLAYCLNLNDDGTFKMIHMHRVKKPTTTSGNTLMCQTLAVLKLTRFSQ